MKSVRARRVGEGCGMMRARRFGSSDSPSGVGDGEVVGERDQRAKPTGI